MAEMKLTGKQVEAIYNISDHPGVLYADDVILSRNNGVQHIDVYRPRDGLKMRIDPSGSGLILRGTNEGDNASEENAQA